MTGRDASQMSNSGSSERGQPFDHHHGLLQQHELRLELHVEAARGLEQLSEQERHRDLLRGEAEDRLADGAQRLGEGLDAVGLGHEAGVEMHLRDADVVAREEAAQASRP